MKKLFFLTIGITLLTGCTLLSTNKEKITNISATSLSDFESVEGDDPENFYHGPCMYLHGEDGEIKNWQDFDSEKKQKLESLFNEVATTKLDYSKNPNNVSDEIYIGPLCDCEEYKKASGLIDKYNLKFPSELAHGYTKGLVEAMDSCVDFSEFK